MVSSDRSTCRAASPRGMKLSSLVTLADGTPELPVDQRRDDRLGDAAGAAGLVDHQHPSRHVGLAQDVLDRQRGQPPEVQHPRGDPRQGEAAGHPQTQVDAVAEGDDGQVTTVAVGPPPAERAWPAAQAAGALYGASHRPSSSSCRSRVW